MSIAKSPGVRGSVNKLDQWPDSARQTMLWTSYGAMLDGCRVSGKLSVHPVRCYGAAESGSGERL
jgi:hypothetical protein